MEEKINQILANQIRIMQYLQSVSSLEMYRLLKDNINQTQDIFKKQ